MKKTILVLTLVGVLALSLSLAGSAYAQGASPPGRGAMGGLGLGPLHTYMVEAMARVLKMNTTELQARLDAGEGLYQIALSKGFKAEEIPALMQTARAEALKKAVADGVITQAQADWMLQHMADWMLQHMADWMLQHMNGQVGFGGGRGGMGTGPCGGTGVPIGQGGRWGTPAQQP